MILGVYLHGNMKQKGFRKSGLTGLKEGWSLGFIYMGTEREKASEKVVLLVLKRGGPWLRFICMET